MAAFILSTILPTSIALKTLVSKVLLHVSHVIMLTRYDRLQNALPDASPVPDKQGYIIIQYPALMRCRVAGNIELDLAFENGIRQHFPQVSHHV